MIVTALIWVNQVFTFGWKNDWDNSYKWRPRKTFSRSYLQRRKMEEKRRQKELLTKKKKLHKRCAWLILDSPRDARSYDNFQKLKWLPVDQLFKLNKLGLLKKVIDGRAPAIILNYNLGLRFEHKYSTRTETLCHLPKPRTEAMRRTFFYSTIKELNALNLEQTTSNEHWVITSPQTIRWTILKLKSYFD